LGAGSQKKEKKKKTKTVGGQPTRDLGECAGADCGWVWELRTLLFLHAGKEKKAGGEKKKHLRGVGFGRMGKRTRPVSVGAFPFC